ncbi:MAG: DNA protecting protein DprA [Elusimicrobia bacterium RIFCSPLOWO2_01_FULL_59_12]|nr:MAG: DNA protecting protein DprA [Elusimicrobia bacterium RIFCSPLOWO2_01_FULL_59_12]
MNRGLLLENERDAWIFLNRIPELSAARFHRLLYAAQSGLGILELSVAGLQAADVTRDVAERWHRAFRAPEHHRWLEAERERLSKGVCRLATELDEEYPARLREVVGRPPVLYYKGRWPPPPEGCVGLVGTRRPSAYGRTVAERLTTDLTVQGVATISGLAKGIDTCVHEATLRAGGHTMAVLGCGLGQVYPPQNAALQERIAEYGTLVSEFPYEAPPDARHFPQRNRIISGLARGVVVIEAGARSGASITARCAAEQGRDVYAVPGSIFEPMSAGCHRLIQEGAKCVARAADILDDLGIQAVTPAVVSGGPVSSKSLVRQTSGGDEVAKSAVFDTLSALENNILQLVAGVPMSADEISQKTAQRFDQVANSLLSLELKGRIRALPGQRYARR